MKAAAQTLDIIRSALQTGKVTGAVEMAAAQYARLCTEAEERLEKIAAMLEKGSDYQALQTAEQEPPLMDLVASLSFGGEKAWQDFCRAQQLPIAPRLDAATVQALDRVYAQGITANHPLYKDFRAAALSRDDKASLRIVRTILKLNPGDENARTEMQRLVNKHFQSTLDQLRAALKTDDEAHISALAEELARSAPEEKLQSVPDYQKADAIRRALRRRQAEERLPALVEEAEATGRTGDWRSLAMSLEIVHDLMNAHGIALPAANPLQQRLDGLAAYVRRERAAAEKRQSFENCLSAFTTFVMEVETRMMTGNRPTYPETAQMDEVFVRRWRELEAFQMPVANDVLLRLRQAGQELRAWLEKLQRARRQRTLLGAATALAVLGALLAVGWHAWQARSLAMELAGYRARNLAGPAEQLVNSLRTGSPLSLRWPFLKSRVEETDVWVRQAGDLAGRVDGTLAGLAAVTSQGSGSAEPGAVLRQIEDARALIDQLPDDLAEKPRSRLAVIKSRLDSEMDGLQNTRLGKARAILDEATDLAAKELSHERLAASNEQVVKKLENLLATLDPWLKPEAEALRLPQDLEARVSALRKRVEEFKVGLAAFDELRAKTARVENLANYKLVLPQWQEVRFIEASPAARVLNILPTEEAFLAGLLTDGDLLQWKAVVEDSSGAHMGPDSPTEKDLKTLLALRDDKDLNGIWENSVTNHGTGARRTVWSRGELTEAAVSGSMRRWSGLCYDPRGDDPAAAFVDKEFRRVSLEGGGNPQGESVTSSRQSRVSAMMDALQLNRMTDVNGERYLRSLLDVFDRIMAAHDAPALARAYVMLELERLVEERPFAWGLHHSPTLRADLEELRQAVAGHPLRGDDWMVPKHAEAAAALSKYFSTRKDRAYLKEAQARREMLAHVVAAGVKFGGYVEPDLGVRLINSARTASELWVLGAKDGKPMRLDNPSAAAAPGAENTRLVAAGALALSPVFYISVDRASLLDGYFKAVTSTPPDSPWFQRP